MKDALAVSLNPFYAVGDSETYRAIETDDFVPGLFEFCAPGL